MTEQNKARELMDQATNEATENVRGVNFSDTDAALDQFNSKIDQASKLASAKVKYNK